MRGVLPYLLLGALVACSIAQLVRDRALFVMLWTFVPVLPTAALALGIGGEEGGQIRGVLAQQLGRLVHAGDAGLAKLLHHQLARDVDAV